MGSRGRRPVGSVPDDFQVASCQLRLCLAERGRHSLERSSCAVRVVSARARSTLLEAKNRRTQRVGRPGTVSALLTSESRRLQAAETVPLKHLRQSADDGHGRAPRPATGRMYFRGCRQTFERNTDSVLACVVLSLLGPRASDRTLSAIRPTVLPSRPACNGRHRTPVLMRSVTGKGSPPGSWKER